jgi:hypothetical protein
MRGEVGAGREEAMRSLRQMGLLVGSFALAMAAPVTVAQMQQQMPGSSPMGMPGGTSAGRGGKTQPTQPQLPPVIAPDAGPTDGKLEHDQAKLRNIDRQKQIVADTQKLVELTNQLNEAVEKSNKDTLSLDVIRKADEIEKLAKSVREKMKGS